MSSVGAFSPTLRRAAQQMLAPVRNGASTQQVNKTAMSRIPTKDLLRSLFLTSLMTKEWIMAPSLAVLDAITKSKAAYSNPDRNPILNRLLRWSIYNHFCAGSSNPEVKDAIASIKSTGYQGVILGFAKEIVLDPSDGAAELDGHEYSPACYKMVEEWKTENLKTLGLISAGDFLSVKLTGAGPIAVDALVAGEPMPPLVSQALDEICEATAIHKARLWIDAEQQVLQPTVDNWVIELMRRHNQGRGLVYNTIQAYLKGSKKNVERHITLAAQEGWTLGVKLVRGAYIEHEVRGLIHDNKNDTDHSYDQIADMFISQKLPAGTSSLQFPASRLFLGTHNAPSAKRAISCHRQRILNGFPTTELDCGQVMGMADELSCQLLEDRKEFSKSSGIDQGRIPGIYKYLVWGSVAECMGYLHRRAIENRGAVARTRHMVDALKKELYGRLARP